MFSPQTGQKFLKNKIGFVCSLSMLDPDKRYVICKTLASYCEYFMNHEPL